MFQVHVCILHCTKKYTYVHYRRVFDISEEESKPLMQTEYILNFIFEKKLLF
jgi:hypothetical protein